MRAQREAMTQQLASILCDPVPVPLLHVARQLEVNCDYLRDRYPEQSAAIVSRFKAYQTGHITAKKAAFSVARYAPARSSWSHKTSGRLLNAFSQDWSRPTVTQNSTLR